jgi:hypothetical protein
MGAPSVAGDGIKDGTIEIESGTSTDEIFSNDFIYFHYILYDNGFIYAA